jgi:Domain of unknown function (DUF4189)
MRAKPAIIGEIRLKAGRGTDLKRAACAADRTRRRCFAGLKKGVTMPPLRMPTAWALVSLLALAFWSAPAAADYYGALAFSQDSGSDGYSIDYETRGRAEEEALQACGDNCEVVLWFKNACGALAVGTDNGYGTGWASSRREAETIAKSACNRNSTSCCVQRWACTTSD